MLSGVFEQEGYGLWVFALLIVCGASLGWGLARRQFAFVAYAAVYGYVGVSSLFLRGVNDETTVLTYFVFSGVAMLVALVMIGVLKGSFFFLAALARRISIPLRIDFLGISSFSNKSGAPGLVRISKDLDDSIEGDRACATLAMIAFLRRCSMKARNWFSRYCDCCPARRGMG